jgi:hypothetical protein
MSPYQPKVNMLEESELDILTGLCGTSHLNGTYVRLLRFDKERERW